METKMPQKKQTENKPKTNQTSSKKQTHQDVNVNVNVKRIIDYLNIKTNSKFKYTSKTTQTKINARLNEGYTPDDFIVVIDKKVKEWTGTEFEKYLCPETLFGTKFEKYLNQKEKTTKGEQKPSWYNAEIEEERATTEEMKEIERRLRGAK